ncbi:MAG TPA: xanthine dehydrogenase family protein subunit M [Burkholderiales bacterium]|jgi:xanthine dehydrogenase YagS FAD-binding subunit
MQAFSYTRPASVDEALRAGAADGSVFIGGGTNLLDLVKNDVAKPIRLVDINRLPLAVISETPGGGLSIGALARNSDTAYHALVRTRYPVLSQALLAGASPQLRNMATVGGNLMQRTRCGYFTDTGFAMCNKRNPGSGCAALQGRNRMHAVLGGSAQCVAVNPSDMSVALAALDASVVLRGPQGERRVALTEFHRVPGNTPERDTNLMPGELITAVELPPPMPNARSHYLKVRDRASYAFALASAAVVLDTDGRTIRSARIALGGVATKPWRALATERALAGQRMDAAVFRRAAALAVRDAHPLRENAFKIELAQRTVVRALQEAGGAA